MSRSINPRPQFFDSSGDPLVSGKMYFYESETDTPKATYADVNLSIQNAHPVALSADGRLPNVFFDGAARQVLTDADDVQVFDVDPAGDSGLGGNFEPWVASIAYAFNALVEASDGNWYKSFISGNLGNDPTTTPTAWQEVDFINTWNTNVTYDLGDTVKASDNLFYTSLSSSNQGNDPTTDAINWGPAFDGVTSVAGGTGITLTGTAAAPIINADNNGDMTAAVYDPAGITEQLVGLTAAQTLTTKSIALASNTLTGTTAQFNVALSDNDFATLAGTETLTNKTLTLPVISAIVNTGTLTVPTSTDTLLGRSTTDTLTNKTFDANATGNSLSNVDVADLSDGTAGELQTWAAGGAPAVVATGTATHILTSNGLGAAPTFQAAAASGVLIQEVYNPYTAMVTGTTAMPRDDTIPQNTEGDEYMAVTITPTSASSILVIEVVAGMFYVSTIAYIQSAIFQDSTAGALNAMSTYNPIVGGAHTIVMKHSMVAGTTSATTFKFRFGGTAGGNNGMNGNTTNRLFGGVAGSSMTVKEYTP